MHKILHFQVSLQLINVNSLNQVMQSTIRQENPRAFPSSLKKPLLLSLNRSHEHFFLYSQIYEVSSCYSQYLSLKSKASVISYMFFAQMFSGILFIILHRTCLLFSHFNSIFPATAVQKELKNILGRQIPCSTSYCRNK